MHYWSIYTSDTFLGKYCSEKCLLETVYVYKYVVVLTPLCFIVTLSQFIIQQMKLAPILVSVHQNKCLVMQSVRSQIRDLSLNDLSRWGTCIPTIASAQCCRLWFLQESNLWGVFEKCWIEQRVSCCWFWPFVQTLERFAHQDFSVHVKYSPFNCVSFTLNVSPLLFFNFFYSSLSFLFVIFRQVSIFAFINSQWSFLWK